MLFYSCFNKDQWLVAAHCWKSRWLKLPSCRCTSSHWAPPGRSRGLFIACSLPGTTSSMSQLRDVSKCWCSKASKTSGPKSNVRFVNGRDFLHEKGRSNLKILSQQRIDALAPVAPVAQAPLLQQIICPERKRQHSARKLARRLLVILILSNCSSHCCSCHSGIFDRHCLTGHLKFTTLWNCTVECTEHDESRQLPALASKCAAVLKKRARAGAGPLTSSRPRRGLSHRVHTDGVSWSSRIPSKCLR